MFNWHQTMIRTPDTSNNMASVGAIIYSTSLEDTMERVGNHNLSDKGTLDSVSCDHTVGNW